MIRQLAEAPAPTEAKWEGNQLSRPS